MQNRVDRTVSNGLALLSAASLGVGLGAAAETDVLKADTPGHVRAAEPIDPLIYGPLGVSALAGLAVAWRRGKEDEAVEGGIAKPAALPELP